LFPSAGRHASHLADTLFIAHLNSAGENEDSMLWKLCFRSLSLWRFLWYTLFFNILHT